MKETKPKDMRFLLCDDRSHSFYFARRRGDEVKPEYHTMRIGEYRSIGEGLLIQRAQ